MACLQFLLLAPQICPLLLEFLIIACVALAFGKRFDLPVKYVHLAVELSQLHSLCGWRSGKCGALGFQHSSLRFQLALTDCQFAHARSGRTLPGGDAAFPHFTFGESLMEGAGYEFCRAHKRVHEVFVKRVSEYRLCFRVGEDIGDELLPTLSHWLSNHIRNDDEANVDSMRRHMRDFGDDPREGGWLSRA